MSEGNYPPHFAGTAGVVSKDELTYFFASGNRPNLERLSDEDLLFNAYELSKQWYGSQRFDEPKERDLYDEDHNILSKILRELMGRKDCFIGRSFPNEFLAQYSTDKEWEEEYKNGEQLPVNLE